MDKLMKLIAAIDTEQIPEWLKQTQKTMMILAFSEIKRGGEYTEDKKNGRGLYHKDLTRKYDEKSDQHYLIWTRITGKTHRAGSEKYPLQSVIVCKCNRWSPKICPYHNMMKLYRLKMEHNIPSQPKDAVFLWIRNGKITPYNKYSHGKLLKRMARKANININQGKETKYSLHGFRKGGCMQATIDGLPTSTIMKQADWKTADMINLYNRLIPIDMHLQNVIKPYNP